LTTGRSFVAIKREHVLVTGVAVPRKIVLLAVMTIDQLACDSAKSI
jgi:hypothetical protein